MGTPSENMTGALLEDQEPLESPSTPVEEQHTEAVPTTEPTENNE